jgi:hypothetical protein
MAILIDKQVRQQEYQLVSSSISEDEALIHSRLSYVMVTTSCLVLLIVVVSCYVPLGPEENTMLIRCTIIIEQRSSSRKVLYFLLKDWKCIQ